MGDGRWMMGDKRWMMGEKDGEEIWKMDNMKAGHTDKKKLLSSLNRYWLLYYVSTGHSHPH